MNFVNDLSLKQYFADRDIFCAGRVTEEDLQRVAAATGGTVQTSVNNIIDEVVQNYVFGLQFFPGKIIFSNCFSNIILFSN